MGMTGIGGELRNKSIACSLNFVEKSLREVLDFCAVHLLRLFFPVLPITMRSGVSFLKF